MPIYYQKVLFTFLSLMQKHLIDLWRLKMSPVITRDDILESFNNVTHEVNVAGANLNSFYSELKSAVISEEFPVRNGTNPPDITDINISDLTNVERINGIPNVDDLGYDDVDARSMVRVMGERLDRGSYSSYSERDSFEAGSRAMVDHAAALRSLSGAVENYNANDYPGALEDLDSARASARASRSWID
jgi:hypothetical protein